MLLLLQGGSWGTMVLSPQTLAWQPEEICRASAAAGWLSPPRTLGDRLGKHIDCIGNALQISSRAVGLYCQGAPFVAAAMKIAGVAKLSSC